MSNDNAVIEASSPATSGLEEFVIARVGDTHVAVPADRVEIVLDGSVGVEPPCAERWVGGWFEHRDRLWLAVRLDRRARRGTQQKRIVIRESEFIRFAIEVDEVFGSAALDEVTAESFVPDDWSAPAGWLRRGTAFDGRPVCCVDVDAVSAKVAVG